MYSDYPGDLKERDTMSAALSRFDQAENSIPGHQVTDSSTAPMYLKVEAFQNSKHQLAPTSRTLGEPARSFRDMDLCKRRGPEGGGGAEIGLPIACSGGVYSARFPAKSVLVVTLR